MTGDNGSPDVAALAVEQGRQDERLKVLFASHKEMKKLLEDRTRLLIYLFLLVFGALASLVWDQFVMLLPGS